MLLALASSQRPKTLFHEPPSQRLMIHLPAFLLQFLCRQCGTKIRIALLITGEHLAAELGLFAPPSGLATTLVHQAGVAHFLEAPPDPLGLPLTHAHRSARFGQTERSFFDLG